MTLFFEGGSEFALFSGHYQELFNTTPGGVVKSQGGRFMVRWSTADQAEAEEAMAIRYHRLRSDGMTEVAALAAIEPLRQEIADQRASRRAQEIGRLGTRCPKCACNYEFSDSGRLLMSNPRAGCPHIGCDCHFGKEPK